MDGLFAPPSVITGLLGEQEAERLRKQSIGTGLVGALIGGLTAAPLYRTQGIAPILGQALSAGFQGSQNVYSNALENYMTQQRISEMQRQQSQQKMREEAIAGLSPEEQAIARIDPNSLGNLLVAKQKPVKAARQLTTAEAESRGLRVGEGQMYQETADGKVEFIPGTEPPKAEKAPTSYQEYQLAKDGGYQGSYIDFLNQQGASKAPKTVVSVSTESFGKEFGKGIAERVSKTYDNALAAQSTLETIRTIRPALASGVYSGPLANQQRLVAQIGSKLGVTGQNTQEILKNSAQAIQGLAQLELEAAQAMRGQGQITENEREIIRRASAGRLENFTVPETQTLLNVLEKTSNFKIQAHKRSLSALRKRKDVGDLLDMYELPEQQAPQSSGAKVRVDY